MSKILKLSTKESLFDPIEIEIDDKKYQTKPLSKILLDQVFSAELRKKAEEGDLDALYTQVQLIYDVPKAILEKLDMRDVAKVIRHTTDKMTEQRTEGEEEGEEKNEPGPGNKK